MRLTREQLEALLERVRPMLSYFGRRKQRMIAAGFQAKDKLLPMPQPYPDDEMTAYPVRTMVNSPKNQGELCIEPITEAS